MNFYASLIFLGIILVILSLAWVLADRKKAFGAARDLDRKKQELVEIINDAEQMIEELNKFSDYIVTQMDLKNEELETNLKTAEDNIKMLGEKAQAVSFAAEHAVTARSAEVCAGESILAVNGTGVFNPVATETEHHKLAVTKSDKVIHINNKYSEVLRLADGGLSELEIAKSLNMGKGEVALILGVNRNG